MIDHDHAIKLAAKCREMSRQLDAHGSWPFMIEVADTIEQLIVQRETTQHLVDHDSEPIIQVAHH